MKFKALPFIVAALAAASFAHADVNISDNVNIDGTVTIATTPVTVSEGTAPGAATNLSNTGYSDSGQTGFQFGYLSKGTGTQTTTSTVGGGVEADTDGNVTLNQVSTQTDVVTYNVESRILYVSNPAGYTDPVTSIFYANGTVIPAGVTLPDGTVYAGPVDVATTRDTTTGDLTSVLSDLAGVGTVTATDANGYPILTQTQINAAVAAGAPSDFVTSTTSSPTGGNLSVAGQTTTHGIDNSGSKITNVADGTAATDAVNKGQLDAQGTTLQSNIDAEAATRASEDTLIRNEFRTADTTLQNNINTEAATRASEDTLIRDEFRSADAAIITDYTQKIDAEASARIFNDSQIRDEFRSADADIRNEFRSADRKLKRAIDKNTRGIAMVAAMTNTKVEAGKTHGVDFNISQFSSSTGFAFGYANRINDKVQLQAALASSEDFEEAVGRIGVSVQW
ncbi:MAG: hypothetical protein QM680_01685 [Luteolibacter sp.]